MLSDAGGEYRENHRWNHRASRLAQDHRPGEYRAGHRAAD
jgi:hypothetical protein